MLKDKVEWKDGRRKRAMKVGLAVRHFCAQASHYALFILGHLQARKSLTGNLHREIDPVLGLPAYVSSGLAGQIVFLAIHSYSQTPAYPISSCFANPHQSYQGALHISNLSSRTHVSHIKKLFTSAIFLHEPTSVIPRSSSHRQSFFIPLILSNLPLRSSLTSHYACQQPFSSPKRTCL